MPYCPKCDMEFIDGITVCSDCGGPLVASKEVADEMKRQKQEEELKRQKELFEKAQAEYLAETGADAEEGELQQEGEAGVDPDAPGYTSDSGLLGSSSLRAVGRRSTRTRVYVKKSQQYEDLKSSASAFLLLGVLLTAGSLLLWTGIIRLPMAGVSRIISQSVLTLMGVGSLAIAFTSGRSAKEVSSQVSAEEEVTAQLVSWFTENFRAEELDAQITAESGEDLSAEERSLKRFDLIQDLIVTNHDITDQSYVDLLAEEIYGKMFRD